jgi:hypothetical protein
MYRRISQNYKCSFVIFARHFFRYIICNRIRYIKWYIIVTTLQRYIDTSIHNFDTTLQRYNNTTIQRYNDTSIHNFATTLQRLDSWILPSLHQSFTFSSEGYYKKKRKLEWSLIRLKIKLNIINLINLLFYYFIFKFFYEKL